MNAAGSVPVPPPLPILLLPPMSLMEAKVVVGPADVTGVGEAGDDGMLRSMGVGGLEHGGGLDEADAGFEVTRITYGKELV